jgi:nitrate reductase NapE component
MEELTKQVRGEILRTLLWAVVSLGCVFAFRYLVW